MRIGIVSDSHGQMDRLERAVGLLVSRGAEALVHCGDLDSVDCLKVLAGPGLAAYAVGGNVDRTLPDLPEQARLAGVRFHWRQIELPLGDGRFLVATHGHDERLVDELLAGQEFPYVCVGHSHQPYDQRHGAVRLINPGALYRAVVYTIALLDTQADTVEFIELNES